MKGVQIFTHSLRQVLNNLPAALRISGVLYLVQVAVSLAFGRAMMSAGMGGMMGGGYGIGALVFSRSVCCKSAKIGCHAKSCIHGKG